jgi:Gelsolin repeat
VELKKSSMTIEDPRISSRMSESDNIPVLGRVYKCTVQRISCNLKQFSSYATFLLVSDRSRKIFIWIGRASSLEDTVLAENVAFDILRDDYQNIGEIVTIKEGIEHQQKLVAMLDQLFMTLDDYVELASLRLTIVENSPITLSTIERKRSEHHNDDYVLNPVSHSPISRSGSVAPLPFLLHVDRKTIAILTTGNQYDIW